MVNEGFDEVHLCKGGKIWGSEPWEENGDILEKIISSRGNRRTDNMALIFKKQQGGECGWNGTNEWEMRAERWGVGQILQDPRPILWVIRRAVKGFWIEEWHKKSFQNIPHAHSHLPVSPATILSKPPSLVEILGNLLLGFHILLFILSKLSSMQQPHDLWNTFWIITHSC